MDLKKNYRIFNRNRQNYFILFIDYKVGIKL